MRVRVDLKLLGLNLKIRSKIDPLYVDLLFFLFLILFIASSNSS